MKTRDTNELLKKVQKGATAGFNSQDWMAIVDAIGWLWTSARVDRETIYHVTAANGDVFKLEKKPGYRVITFYDFVTWAKAHGLMEAVEAKAGPVPTKAPRRDMTNTGTCACCFGNFKLKQTVRVTHLNPNWGASSEGDEDKVEELDVMVLHGYQRPGHGYIVGNCHGIRFEPYELSCEGTKYMLGLVERAIFNKKSAIDMLKTTNELWVKRWDADEHKHKSAILRTSETSILFFEAERRTQLASAEHELRSMERDQAMLTKKVTEWKRMPLPGNKETK